MSGIAGKRIEERGETNIELRPQIIEKEGKKEFAVLLYDEFLRVQEELEDYEDLRQLREAKEQDKEAPVAELRKELGEE